MWQPSKETHAAKMRKNAARARISNVGSPRAPEYREVIRLLTDQVVAFAMVLEFGTVDKFEAVNRRRYIDNLRKLIALAESLEGV